jgi:3D (Asp-Asp-Asp) domain-containing protein
MRKNNWFFTGVIMVTVLAMLLLGFADTIFAIENKVNGKETSNQIETRETEKNVAEEKIKEDQEEQSGLTDGAFSVILNASAYTTGEAGVGTTTASGNTVEDGVTVAMGSSYSFGTQVYIPALVTEANDGIYTVQDRGGAISDSHIDIYMDSYDKCTAFGRQDIEVYILS